MVTFRWLVRLFFWLPLCLKQLFDDDNLGPWYAMELCLVTALGTVLVILTIFSIVFSEEVSYLVLGACVFVYLLIGSVFFFTNRSSNCNPVWQNNGPW